MKYSVIKGIAAAVFAVIIIASAVQIALDASLYRRALGELGEGNFESARALFGELDCYRDARVLCEYAALRCEFDPDSTSSVFRSYPKIRQIADEYSGDELRDEIGCTAAYIGELYNELPATLCARGLG